MKTSDWLIHGRSEKALLREKYSIIMATRKQFRHKYGIEPCPWCYSNPELRRVGDWKEYYVFFCPDCDKTPVSYDEARSSLNGAVKIWNKRAKETAKQRLNKKT